MNVPRQVNTNRYLSRYVDGAAGWRFFFFSVAIASLIGLSFRLYFNPDRIRTWAEEVLAEQGAAADIRFRSAQLRLARGSLPLLAIEMSSVDFSLAKDCPAAPGLRIAKLWVPLSFSSLFAGRLSVGTIAGDDVEIDIEALKDTSCSVGKNAAVDRAASSRAESSSSARVPAMMAAPSPWWKPEQLAEIGKAIKGVRLERVSVFFEEKTKKVYLNTLRVWIDSAERLKLESDIVVPPELVYGERLPVMRASAEVEATAAHVRVSAGLSEGSLVATGILRPASGGMLDAEIESALSNVPLSTLAPLMTRSGIVAGEFRPRFMWMNCRAKVRGRFQGLLNENPLTLEDCEIVGQGARIHVALATRQANGKWDPLKLEMKNVDLRRIFDTFQWQGPEGVFSEYGRLTGVVDVPSAGTGSFDGAIEDALIRFSSRSQVALQKLKRMSAQIGFKNGRLEGHLEKLDLEGGDFEGDVAFTLSHDFGTGHAQATIKRVRLQDNVQQVLFAGSLGNLSGHAEASLREGRLTGVKSLLRLKELKGRDFQFAEASAETAFDSSTGEIQILLKSPGVEIAKASPLAQGTRKLFFGHEFASEWIMVRDVAIRARFPKPGGFAWEDAFGSLENGRIRLASAGQFNRERDVSGWVNLDFPTYKKLKWQIGGKIDSPDFSDDSKSLAELRKHAIVDDRLLGLGEKKSEGRVHR